MPAERPASPLASAASQAAFALQLPDPHHCFPWQPPCGLASCRGHPMPCPCRHPKSRPCLRNEALSQCQAPAVLSNAAS